MFFLVVRKILHNKWLMASLLIGTLLAVSMVGSIPLYTDGILQRMLRRDMEAFQHSSGYYPGHYQFTLNAFTFYKDDQRMNAYLYFDKQINEEYVPALAFPVKTAVKRFSFDHVTVLPKHQREETPKSRYMALAAYTDYENYVEIQQGRMPQQGLVDGVYEVLVTPRTLQHHSLLLDEVLILTDETKQMQPILVKPVGLYTRKDDAGDAWWFDSTATMTDMLLMDYDTFHSDFILEQGVFTTVQWYFAMDYPQLKIDNIANVVQSAAEQRETYMSYAGTNMIFPATKVLEQYSAREQQLRTTLWVLQVPILLMLAFYIFMVSQLIVQNDRNEIAVYKSRGASRLQILGTYLLQSLLLSGLAVALGPLVAMGICKVLGASNGFLELVSRTALPLQMRPRTLLYAGIAGAFTVVMMMAPVFSASGTDIVQHKQRRARLWKAPLWQKLFLDGILLGVSIYGLYTYSLRQQTLMVTAAEGVSVPIDPFLFIISTVFVLGAGLLFLRLYPLVVRLLSWAGRKLWPPAPYAAFVEVGRSGGRQQFLMLFLIFTVSVGIFSANSARTINQNVADKVHYQIGADLAVSSQWQSNQKTFSSGPMGSADAMAASTTESTVVIYKEPLYETYEGLAGTEAAAKVLMPNDVSISTSSRRSHRGTLMAVQPDQFGKVVWSDAKLLPHHINVYLNLMAQTPSAVIVSNQLLQDLDLAAGDSIYVTWAKQPEVECIIYAGVEFWPGINPYTDMGKYFVVANLDYVQALTALEPYEVWYKRTPGATSAQIYDDMQQRGLAITKVLDANQQIIERKNDALLQGTNGAMTLGFVVTMAISMIGFFIYWILSIRARTLQFGILRAMGMSKASVMGALLCEQVLISGAAIIAGVFIGGIMSDLFVPLLGLVYSAADQVPPFKVVAQRADYIRLYSIIGVMMGACMALLTWLISRIKVAQAIKLGED